MMSRVTGWIVGTCVVAVLAIGGHAESIVFDDFSDGDITDGDPARWRRVGNIQWRIQDGSLNLYNNATDQNGGIGLRDPLQGDLSIRTRMRFLDGVGGIVSLHDLRSVDGYYAFVADDGVFEAGLTANGVDYSDRVDMPPVVGLDEDLVIQLDHFGDSLMAWYWLASGKPPASPQVMVSLDDDLRIADGYTGVWVGPGLVEAISPSSLVRYVQIEDTHIPMPETRHLMPGDANEDLAFDQRDLVLVLQAGKYMTGQPATWGEGDWDAAPGGQPGSPPVGDGLFNQLDIVTALAGGAYLTGPYAGLSAGLTEAAMVAAVPEPSSAILLVLGLLVLAGRGGSLFLREVTQDRQSKRRRVGL